MGVLAECDPVPDVVVPRVGELMDVRCVDDASRRDGKETVTRQCTRIVIQRDDVESEPDLSPPLCRFFGRPKRGGNCDFVFARNRQIQKGAKCYTLVRWEVFAD